LFSILQVKKEIPMDHSKKLISVTVAILLATFLAFSSVATLPAQQRGEIKRKLLTKQDLSVRDRECLLFEVELSPGAREVRHTHPGELFGYLREGNVTLHVEGQSTVTLKPGEVFFVPAGKIHWGENAEKTAVKLLVVYFVEKGKPLISSVK